MQETQNLQNLELVRKISTECRQTYCKWGKVHPRADLEGQEGV